ncbi:grpE protein homolog 2, mitochondrial-like isoform X2 [Protopterus annectens]|uniref:grpE protein homolog 2, mitochondrial-like isoform X2 n=1 Tax=Protopterus annectens TaxID=7888 RepID=UPI001CFADAAB|nr:grpE protein homolog 2, mitochondrial-like isoform X2 [Protopterus annectens]
MAIRGSVSLFSTAVHQKNTGEDSVTEDSQEDPHTGTIRALEQRANKLEEQVRDLSERCRLAVADSENVRKKTQKFVEDAKLFGM